MTFVSRSPIVAKDPASDSVETGSLVDVVDLSVRLAGDAGTVEIVRGISFRLRRGGSLGIIGESGSGKSMAVRALMQLISGPGAHVEARRLKFDEIDLLGLSPAQLVDVRGSKMALVFQDSIASLNPLLTVGYQICEVLRSKAGLGRAAARKAATRLLASVGIPDAAARLDAFPHEFSGGMRQRVMIAIALALDPQLLVADEPTTALDVTIQAQIVDLLNELRQRSGMALILITHDLAVASELVDEVAVMYAGRIVESGPIEEVFANPLNPYTRALLRSIPDSQSRGRPLEAIPGAPPSPYAPPGGCAFHPRCSFAVDACRMVEPPVEEIGQGRTTACLRWRELAA